MKQWKKRENTFFSLFKRNVEKNKSLVWTHLGQSFVDVTIDIIYLVKRENGKKGKMLIFLETK